jgi:hypothetical protein
MLQLRGMATRGASTPAGAGHEAALASISVIETELRPAVLGGEPILASGWGGDVWDDGDPGDEWGWSEGPDGSEDTTPYRRSRIVRAIALVTVVAVVTGSIGTWVAVLAVGSPQPSYPTSAVRAHVAAADQKTPTALPIASVSFVVSDNSSLAGRATCRVVVSTKASGVVGSSAANTVRLAPGTSTPMAIRVALSSDALAGNGPAGVQVACTPMRTRPG